MNYYNITRLSLPNSFYFHSSRIQISIYFFCFEPGHRITYKPASEASEDSDQPALPHSLISVFEGHLVGSQGSKAFSGGQWILWSVCADAQTDLSIRWSHKQYCRKCCGPALLYRYTWLHWEKVTGCARGTKLTLNIKNGPLCHTRTANVQTGLCIRGLIRTVTVRWHKIQCNMIL